MKAILLSVQPEYVQKILNGEKTIEIRKSMPKCELPVDVYIYCTKDKNEGWYLGSPDGKKWSWSPLTFTIYGSKNIKPQGKVVAKFTLKQCDNGYFYTAGDEIESPFARKISLVKECALTPVKFCDYMAENYSDANQAYAWHISDLQIFDKPMELGEFSKPKTGVCTVANCNELHSGHCPCAWQFVSRAPQSWQYIEVPHDK